jgi:hypothetical protein
MMPLWLWLLSGFFLPEGSSVKVPYVNMTLSLILLTVPLGIGILIRLFKLSLAEFLTGKILKKFSICFIIFIFGVTSQYDITIYIFTSIYFKYILKFLAGILQHVPHNDSPGLDFVSSRTSRDGVWFLVWRSFRLGGTTWPSTNYCRIVRDGYAER